MATFKESFSKGITAINVKTNNFMEEAKCKTYISTLESEIKDLKFQIGQKAYEKWSAGENAVEGYEELCQQIKQKYQEIDIQKERIAQLAIEEKQILGAGTNAAPAQAAAPAPDVFCSQCGTPNPASYKFCAKCGASMQ